MDEQATGRVNCEECGASLPPTAKFCSACGNGVAPQPERVRRSQQQSAPEAVQLSRSRPLPTPASTPNRAASERRQVAKNFAAGFGVIAGGGLVLQAAGYEAFGARMNAIIELWWVFALIAAGAGLYYLAN